MERAWSAHFVGAAGGNSLVAAIEDASHQYEAGNARLNMYSSGVLKATEQSSFD